MSTTSKTSEYQLSQVEQNDVPSWISDYSADMAKIDAALANNRNNVSAKFSEDTDYIKGNYCIKDDVLYKFTDAKPAGSWDSTKVEAVTVEGELEAHATAINEQNVNKENRLTFDVSKNINFMSGITVYHTKCKRYGKLCVGYFNCIITKDFAANSVIATVPYSAESWTFVPLRNSNKLNGRGSISSGSNEIKTEFGISANTDLIGEFIWFTND